MYPELRDLDPDDEPGPDHKLFSGSGISFLDPDSNPNPDSKQTSVVDPK